MNVRFALALALAVLSAATPSVQSQRFALAIVRLDGAIVPFAAYDGERWERAWPAANEATERAGTIDGIQSAWRTRGERVPRVWTAWPATGARSVQARVTGVEVVDAHCGRQVALKTNMRPIKAKHPGKFGVAVDSNLPVVSVEALRASDSAWKSAADLVLSNLAKLETAQARTDHQELPRETPQPVARLAALYREARSSRSPLYFVAEKTYRTPAFPQDPSCERITVMTGWLIPSADGGLTLRDARLFLTNCDQKGVRRALPLAAVHVSNRVFWVLQDHGYEDEEYLVAEIGPAGVRYPIAADGGGC